MKTVLLYLFASSILLCASLCGCGEEEYQYIDYTVENADLIVVGNEQNQFAKNDTLWIFIDIPNELTDVEGTSRNVNEVTNAEVAYQAFRLHQLNEFSNAAEIRLSVDDFVIETGEINLSDYDTSFQTISQLVDGSYRSKIGILLRTTGSFYVASANLDNIVTPYFDGISNDNVIYNVLLTTTIKGADNNGRYLFEVQ